jgi:hypothetical protein
MPVVPALRRLRPEDHEFEESLGTVSKKKKIQLDTVANTCNPNYLGGREWEDNNLRSAQAKS